MKEILETFNYQALLEVLEEQYGKRFMLENSDLFYLWFCVQRKQVTESRQKMIEYLDKNNILEDKRHIIATVDRYFRFRNQLPDLKESSQRRLDRANQYLNPIVSFEIIGNRMLGVIDEENQYDSWSVIDISEGKHNVVAVLHKSGGISWRDSNLHPIEMKWITTHNRNIKQKESIV